MNICELSPCKYKPTLNHFWLNNTLTFFSLYCFNKYKLNINWYFNPCVSVWTFWLQQIKWIIVITPQLQLLRSINSPVCLRSLFQFFNFFKWFLFIIQHFWQFNINRDYSWLILVFCLCPFGRFEGLVFLRPILVFWVVSVALVMLLVLLIMKLIHLSWRSRNSFAAFASFRQTLNFKTCFDWTATYDFLTNLVVPAV